MWGLPGWMKQAILGRDQWGAQFADPYPDSEKSDDDVVYTEEYDSELQQINLRSEGPD